MFKLLRRLKPFLFCAYVFRLCAYSDPELEALWSSLSNVNNPSLEDYRLVENYLQNGIRPYFETLRNTSSYYFCVDDFHFREKKLRDFKLLGPNSEMPIRELHHLNPCEATKDRCILMYASYNGIYPEKIYQVLGEIKQCGYSGDVIIQIGGFPNISHGGLKLVPFSGWKQEFIKEARDLGYKKIVHLDTSLHPLNDLSEMFKIIEQHGYFFLHHTWDWKSMAPPSYCKFLKVPFGERDIPWVACYAIGFDFTNLAVQNLFEEWEKLMLPTEDFMMLGPDEFIITALAWRYRFKPVVYLHDCVYGGSMAPDKLDLRGFLFSFDNRR